MILRMPEVDFRNLNKTTDIPKILNELSKHVKITIRHNYDIGVVDSYVVNGSILFRVLYILCLLDLIRSSRYTNISAITKDHVEQLYRDHASSDSRFIAEYQKEMLPKVLNAELIKFVNWYGIYIPDKFQVIRILEANEKDCPICMEKITGLGYVHNQLHFFHKKCLFNWTFYAGRDSCPLCRQFGSLKSKKSKRSKKRSKRVRAL